MTKEKQLEFDFFSKEEKGIEKRVNESSNFRKKEFEPGADFYIPKYKYELVNWLYSYCKRTGKKPKAFESMSKKQLYAIYFTIRKREG